MSGIDLLLAILWGIGSIVEIAMYRCRPGDYHHWCDFYNHTSRLLALHSSAFRRCHNPAPYYTLYCKVINSGLSCPPLSHIFFFISVVRSRNLLFLSHIQQAEMNSENGSY
ncbi:hypothetical protein BX666DRAFT_1913962 [Dichotomocladium elegans]|nr:hypothetical protein BX666DRAFT_1913962 [Dichotomocladium elegans]